MVEDIEKQLKDSNLLVDSINDLLNDMPIADMTKSIELLNNGNIGPIAEPLKTEPIDKKLTTIQLSVGFKELLKSRKGKNSYEEYLKSVFI